MPCNIMPATNFEIFFEFRIEQLEMQIVQSVPENKNLVLHYRFVVSNVNNKTLFCYIE